MHYNIRLKSKIKERGMTQRVLADMIGESDAVVSLLINERYTFPEKRMTDLRRKISKALRVPQNQIFNVT